MSFEKLALFGVIIFGFMALTQALRTVHEAKRQARRKGRKRPRRQASSEPVALQIAIGLVEEVAAQHTALVAEAHQSGTLPKKLEHDLNLARLHYQERVSPRFKGLFYAAIDDVIFKKNASRNNSRDNILDFDDDSE